MTYNQFYYFEYLARSTSNFLAYVCLGLLLLDTDGNRNTTVHATVDVFNHFSLCQPLHASFWKVKNSQLLPFLGVFGKLRKATVILVMEHLGSIWTHFHEIWYWTLFVEKIKVSLKSGKNSVCFTWKPMYIYDIISLYSS